MKKAIIFDVDSTLVTIEGLDYLAQKKLVGAKVAAITNLAMNGKIDFTQALEQRLAIIRPSYIDFIDLAKAYLDHLTPGAIETIQTLKKQNHTIHLVTGGFQPAVGVLANFLGIPSYHVISNQIIFYPNGRYRSFDRHHPLARNGGKAEILRMLKGKISHPIFIGDSVTDLETKPHVDLFIGFGGVVIRQKVKEAAEVYCVEPNLKHILPYV